MYESIVYTITNVTAFVVLMWFALSEHKSKKNIRALEEELYKRIDTLDAAIFHIGFGYVSPCEDTEDT